MDIDHLKQMVDQGDYRLTYHALERMDERKISEKNALEAIRRGRIVQEFPERSPYPECIICGLVKREMGTLALMEPLYVVCAVGPQVAVVTVDWNEPREFGQKRRRRR